MNHLQAGTVFVCKDIVLFLGFQQQTNTVLA